MIFLSMIKNNLKRIFAIGFAFVLGATGFKASIGIFKLMEISEYFSIVEIILSLVVGYVLARLVDKGAKKK